MRSSASLDAVCRPCGEHSQPPAQIPRPRRAGNPQFAIFSSSLRTSHWR